MVGRHEAAAFLRVEIERAGGIEQADQLGAGAARAAAGDDERALAPTRAPRPPRRSAIGIGRRSRAAASAASIRRAPAAAAPSCAARRSGSRHRPGRARRDRPSRARPPRRARARPARRRARCATRGVTGRRMSTCGMSCSGPIFACGRDVQPPISSTGMRASEALAIAVTVLVTPGPAVTMATPSCPVSSACACAMCTAAPSSRTSMMRMPWRAT